MFREPENEALEGSADHRVEILGVGWSRSAALVHDELTNPVDRPLTHQHIWHGQSDFCEAGEDFDGGQCYVHVDLP